MRIVVDALMPSIRIRNWPFDEAAHLMVDPDKGDAVAAVEALHKFAIALGLKRRWFQFKAGSAPH